MAKFNKLGISFQYPDNWRLEMEGRRAVTALNPTGGGFWSVSIHPASANPAALVESAVGALREEYPKLETAPVTGNQDGIEIVGQDVNFCYLDLTITAGVRGFQTDRATYIIFWQAEDAEYEDIGDVILAMTTSLLRGMQ